MAKAIFSVTMDKKVKQRLDKEAKDQERSRSNLIERICRAYFKNTDRRKRS